MKRYRLALWLGLIVIAQTACAENTSYPMQRVADGIFYHQGVHEDATPENLGAIANVGFVIGDNCVAVIDSGGSFAEGKLLHQALREHTDKPVCYVINTHVHPDHMFGNAAFKDDNPVYVGHEKLPAALNARKEFYARGFAETLGDAYIGTEMIGPSKTVKLNAPLTLDLGNRKLTLTAYSTSHTDHDLTVLDHNTKTLWTGDLLFMERIPVIDGSINGWINNIDSLSKLDVINVVPGHGPASNDKWQQGWQNERRYLTTIREQIRQIIADLGTIEQATKTVGLEEKDNWKLFDLYHRRNITAAFVELEWE